MATIKDGLPDEKPAPEIVYLVQQPQRPVAQDEMDVGQMFQVIWASKWWIVAISACVTSLAVVYALIATPWYRAEAVLMPRDRKAGSGLSAQLGQLGGLADVVGLNLGETGRQEPLGVLRSKGFARRFIESHDLVGVLSGGSTEFLSFARRRPDKMPNVQDVVDNFVLSIMTVTEDKRSGLVIVAVEWKDPAIAASWANGLVAQLNDEMRLRAQSEAERNIRYLQEQLEKTSAISLQQGIARLIESEMQKLMLANGTSEYAFRIIDEAQPPARRARPNRTMIVFFALMASVLASCAGVLLVAPLRRLSGATATE